MTAKAEHRPSLLTAWVRNIGWGITWGLVFATLFSAWVVILSVLQGTLVLQGRGGLRIHLLAAVGLYLFGGVSAGFIVGLLKPLTRRRIGSLIVGILAAFPIGLAVMSLLSGFPPTSEDLIAAAIWAVALGGSVGVIYHGIFYDDGPARKKRSR